MANYKLGFKKVMFEEGCGEWTNTVGDNGGETFSGIARKFHPNWKGWAIIDAAKKQPNFPESLQKIPQLQILVEDFYKKEFWDKIGGDSIKSDKIAIQIFDTAVNMGIPVAVKLAQESVGLKQTGIVDIGFITALNKVV